MRLLEAFASSESIVALLNADDGRFLDVNPAFVRISGYDRSRLVHFAADHAAGRAA